MSDASAENLAAQKNDRKPGGRIPTESILVGTGAVGLTLLLTKSLSIAMACVAAMVALMLTPFATGLALLYFGILLAFSSRINLSPFDLGIAKVYGTDFVCLLVAWAVLLRVWNGSRDRPTGGPRNRQERVLLGLLALYTVYGLLSLAYGLFVQHFPTDEAFGDYRRFFFYSLAFAAPILLPFKSVHITRLKQIVVVSCSVLVVIGLWRIVSGSPVRQDIDSTTGYVGVRMLQPDEITTVSILLAYLVLVFRSDPRLRVRVPVVLLIVAAVPLPLLSGYRIALFFVIAAPLLALVLLAWVRKEPLRRVAWLCLGAMVGIVLAIAAAVTIFPQQFARMQRDMMVRMQAEQAQSSWRASTWGQALKEWKQAPIIGTGMGHRLVFPFRTSDGSYRYIDSSVHNMFLEVLYQGGIIAFAGLLSLHGYFAWYVLRALRGLTAEAQVIATALFAGYVTNLGGCLLQSPGISRYVYTYLVMGFLAVIVSVCQREPTVIAQGFEEKPR